MRPRHLPSAALLLACASAHNWIWNPRSRSGNKASTNRPAPPRPKDRDPHVAVAPGQEFLIEWSTGHPNSEFYFVVLHKDDEARLDEHTPDLLDDYIARAPADASASFNGTADGSNAPGGVWRKWHLSCSYLYGVADPDVAGDGEDCDRCQNCGQARAARALRLLFFWRARVECVGRRPSRARGGRS